MLRCLTEDDGEGEKREHGRVLFNSLWKMWWSGLGPHFIFIFFTDCAPAFRPPLANINKPHPPPRARRTASVPFFSSLPVLILFPQANELVFLSNLSPTSIDFNSLDLQKSFLLSTLHFKTPQLRTNQITMPPKAASTAAPKSKPSHGTYQVCSPDITCVAHSNLNVNSQINRT